MERARTTLEISTSLMMLQQFSKSTPTSREVLSFASCCPAAEQHSLAALLEEEGGVGPDRQVHRTLELEEGILRLELEVLSAR